MADRKHGTPPPPTTSTFDAAAWGDTPFSGTRHDAVLFRGVELSDVVQRGAAFVG
jgi:fluoroquinolone resistance protein